MPSRVRRRRAVSTSPTNSRGATESTIEYQSEDSECDCSTSSESTEMFENSSDVKNDVRSTKSDDMLFLPKNNDAHVVEHLSRDYPFLATRLWSKLISILFTVFLMTALLCVANLFQTSPEDSQYTDVTRSRLLAFEKDLSKFGTDFENVTLDDLRLIFHVGRQWFLMRQKRPVVLIVAGDESERFTRALSEVFRSSFQIPSPIVDLDLSSELVRSELHGSLDRVVHSTVPLAILDGVEYLGWDAPLALQAFADDSSPAHPHTLLLLTVRKSFHRGTKECEHSVMEYLSERWIGTGGSMDNVTPVLSRIMQFLICV